MVWLFIKRSNEWVTGLEDIVAQTHWPPSILLFEPLKTLLSGDGEDDIGEESIEAVVKISPRCIRLDAINLQNPFVVWYHLQQRNKLLHTLDLVDLVNEDARLGDFSHF